MSEKEHDDEPVTLSREDLYELVWSKPMSELAKDFRISDVALAKRCKRIGIPVPGRGYWARFDAGQQPYRPKLPERDPEWSDQAALTVGAARESATRQFDCDVDDKTQNDENGLTTAQSDDTWLQERLAFEDLPNNKIDVPAITRKWDPAIERCKDDLEKAAEELREAKKASDKYDKWPESRKRIETDHDGWKWRSVRDRGQRLWDTHKAVCFRVSLDSYKRTLHIVNALALAAPARGFTVREDEEEGRIVFAGYGSEVRLRLAELLDRKTRPRKRYDGTIEQEEYKVPTGRLQVTLEVGSRDGPRFADSDSRPLEGRLNNIYCRIYGLVVKAWKAEREHQAFHRRLEDEERQRASAAKIKAERERALAEERTRRQELLNEANHWTQSIKIRKYVEHIRASATGHSTTASELNNWTDWALKVAAELDPTSGRLTASTESVPVDLE
jgi:hypothetical protein